MLFISPLFSLSCYFIRYHTGRGLCLVYHPSFSLICTYRSNLLRVNIARTQNNHHSGRTRYIPCLAYRVALYSLGFFHSQNEYWLAVTRGFCRSSGIVYARAQYIQLFAMKFTFSSTSTVTNSETPGLKTELHILPQVIYHRMYEQPCNSKIFRG